MHRKSLRCSGMQAAFIKIAGDIEDEPVCAVPVTKVFKVLGGLYILVNASGHRACGVFYHRDDSKAAKTHCVNIHSPCLANTTDRAEKIGISFFSFDSNQILTGLLEACLVKRRGKAGVNFTRMTRCHTSPQYHACLGAATPQSLRSNAVQMSQDAHSDYR